MSLSLVISVMETDIHPIIRQSERMYHVAYVGIVWAVFRTHLSTCIQTMEVPLATVE